MDRVLAWPPVAAGRAVQARYEAAGGGLLAGGLAYSALFAIVPLVLLVAGLVGLMVSDPARRDDVLAFIAAALPPLRDLVQAVLDEAGRDAGALGVVGAVTLLWGATRFLVTFTDAVGRVMGRDDRRGTLARNGVAVVVVLLLPAAIVGGAAITGLVSLVDLAVERHVLAELAGALRVALAALPAVATVLVVGLVYRTVPTPVVRWRALWLPAAVVGVVLAALLQAFAFVAPRLIGAAALLGTIATVFAALAWLSLTFQAVLLGAAWVAERERALSSSRPR